MVRMLFEIECILTLDQLTDNLSIWSRTRYRCASGPHFMHVAVTPTARNFEGREM